MKVSEGLFRPLEELGIEEIGKQMGVDIHSKKLKLIEHVKLLASYVVLRCGSLRELGENSHLHDSMSTISTSQLSKVNNTRDYTAFVLIFYLLLCHPSNYRRHWRLRRFLGKKILGIDSTTITMRKALRLLVDKYPLREKESKGIKIHVAALLGTLAQPLSAIVTPSNVHDSVMFDELLTDTSLFEVLRELIVVFDKGYTDYERYRKLIEHTIYFVAQLKKNAVYKVLTSVEHGRYTEQAILLDGMRLSMVKYRDERDWTFITNIPVEELSADDIRDIYRLRWMIEIFFRELKQAAKIERLYSRSVNGVMIQVYSTLIAYTLVNMYRIVNNVWTSMTKIAVRLKHMFDLPIDLTDPG